MQPFEKRLSQKYPTDGQPFEQRLSQKFLTDGEPFIYSEAVLYSDTIKSEKSVR